MASSRSSLGVFAAALVVLYPSQPQAQQPPGPVIIDLAITNSQKVVRFDPFPAAEQFKMLRSEALNGAFANDASGLFSGYTWRAPLARGDALGFHRLQVVPVSDAALLEATLLNRLAYGATPDDIERLRAIGAQAYIEEQLAPEKIEESLDINAVVLPTGWQYVTATGKGSSTNLYVYLNSAGEGYIDDLKLVAGKVAEAGPNLLRNGDFELPMHTNDWVISENHSKSVLSTEVKRSGNSSLRLVASYGGSSESSSIWQTPKPPLSGSQDYTLSYWFLPTTNQLSSVTVRLSGRGIDTTTPQLTPKTRLVLGTASITDLQSWYVLHAVQSKRQLFEVLTQFIDNHFTTYYPKSSDYMNGRVRAEIHGQLATEFEHRELSKWRDVLLNPNGTFYDLLKISTESPAMIIYLDTVTSTKGAANENYARELMELFTMGVDNGYEQKDIEEMSRAWTGWRVDKLPPGREHDPLVTPVANKDNDPGTWVFRYSASNHDTTAKTMFAGKTIDARFGPPHAGKPYELKLAARTGAAGMQDGYDIIKHLADLPYTQEYLSVKLCQIFVHEDFFHGVYDYTVPNLTAEAALVRDCMKAWDTPAADGRKGNLRNVLRVIFNSELFRGHVASRQKVKTPFEFTVSTVRALRAAKAAGGFTAESTGSDLLAPMDRMGMKLFYREEPDGWSEFGQDWINTSSLVERMRYAQGFLRVGNRSSDPVGLLKMKLAPASWRDASAVTDYFLHLLFQAEGKANLDLDRAAAIAYLNTHENGSTPSLFTSLDPNSSGYDTRVRSMVSLLMGLPRFQEQ